ncbi:transmembrane protein [Legionella nautarum]|uniref:Transmembrane protein n=1 Tax=Legionella nautarum TaxID=45070 RepID=A0A0W0WVP8_9GAMM|nr:hypothetical protein [Legionella nautarum]KTD36389.1 transmembrane protein [Legionella nautarum]
MSKESSDYYMDLLARRKDQSPPPLAKKLHEWHLIYGIYGALDGLSLSYSMIKYLWDVLFGSASNSDEMHDWLIEPEGALAAASGSITLIVFSMLANHYSDDDENLFKRYIAIVWPYCRDTMKGLKNAYKGSRSMLQLIETLSGGQSLAHLFVPIGLALGGISVLNRIWYRRMLTERKTMMKANAKLLEEIQNTTDFDLLPRITDDPTDLDNPNPIKRQSKPVRLAALLSAAYGGVVDGLYLYIGVFGLCSLAPPLLIAMTVFSSIYMLSSIATRIYEEYDYQRKLRIAEAKIELAHSGKTIELMVKKLHLLHLKIAGTKNNIDLLKEQQELVEQFNIAIQLFEQKRKNYRSITTLSYTSAVLAGAKRGLYAYSALASLVFAVGTILVLASTPFPPFLLVSCISIGMLLLIGFIAHSIITTHQHRLKQKEIIEAELGTMCPIEDEKLIHIKWLYDASCDVQHLEPERVKEAVLDGMAIDPTPQFFFEEWFEVIRSFFSGVGKGSKAIGLMMNPLEVTDDKGHYHESLIMMGFIAFSAFIHTITLAARAYARMGKDPLEKPFMVNKQDRNDSDFTSLDNSCDSFECQRPTAIVHGDEGKLEEHTRGEKNPKLDLRSGDVSTTAETGRDSQRSTSVWYTLCSFFGSRTEHPTHPGEFREQQPTRV